MERGIETRRRGEGSAYVGDGDGPGMVLTLENRGHGADPALRDRLTGSSDGLAATGVR